jgi:hypothetical protein
VTLPEWKGSPSEEQDGSSVGGARGAEQRILEQDEAGRLPRFVTKERKSNDARDEVI